MTPNLTTRSLPLPPPSPLPKSPGDLDRPGRDERRRVHQLYDDTHGQFIGAAHVAVGGQPALVVVVVVVVKDLID